MGLGCVLHVQVRVWLGGAGCVCAEVGMGLGVEVGVGLGGFVRRVGLGVCVYPGVGGAGVYIICLGEGASRGHAYVQVWVGLGCVSLSR